MTKRRSFAFAVKLTLCATIGAVAIGPAAVRGEELGSILERLRAAQRSDRVARISGRLIDHSRRSSREVQVRLYPTFSAFTADLEQIRLHARDSAASYFAVAQRLEQALLSYEKQLLAKDAAELILSAQTNDDGLFEFSRVPEGRWTALAWTDATVPVTLRKQHTRSKDQDRFLQSVPPATYQQRDYWFVSVTVVAGEVREVQLTDRNRWISAISR